MCIEIRQKYKFIKLMKAEPIRYCKGLEENPEVIERNMLNVSKSKMQYSFSQADRFQNKKITTSPPKFYDLPNLWVPKGKSIGHSKRGDLARVSVAPSPNSYQIKSSFQKSQNEGITMGKGRDQIKKGNMFFTKNEVSPTATSYQPNHQFNSKVISIGQKIQPQGNKWLKKVPGPGNYSFLQLTNERNKKMVSKYVSAPSSKFGKSGRARIVKNELNPGPGQHDILSPSFDESLYDKPYASKIGMGKRKSLNPNETSTPGPGAYKVFSQFLH